MKNGRLALEFSKEFESSVNIAYDFDNAKKIERFIPTSQGIRFIGDTVSSALGNADGGENRARILIGAYGKGKSYIVLEALSLLHDNPSLSKSFAKIAGEIEKRDPSVANKIRQYLKKKRRLLPVIVNGNSSSVSQSFLAALKSALNRAELKKLMPETHFEAAARMIEKWESKYPETLAKFNASASVRAGRFKENLRRFDANSLEEFQSLYPSLTSGGEFNPFSGFDVVEIFDNVNDALCRSGKYDGIFVVYDEFGKYLESSIAQATVKDVKLLQDFAERAVRSAGNSGGKGQLHLLLICHKEIENYIDALPKQKVDGWRGVSERFRHIRLYNAYSESYELISSAILKDSAEWKNFKAIHRGHLEKLKEDWFGKSGKLFQGEESAETVIWGCYPMHPVTTYILPRLSEKVAQNERTLFTFLSGSGKNALPALCRGWNFEKGVRKFPFFTPDVLFDYFEHQLQSECMGGAEREFLATSGALQKLEADSLEAKIVKTVFLVYFLNQFERMPPSADFIYSLFREAGFSKEDIDFAVKDLTGKWGILYLNVHNHYFQIKMNSGADISRMISDAMEKRKSSVKTVDVLNTFLAERYLYPSEYNVRNKMTRFFRVEFVRNDDLQNFPQKLEKEDFADGYFFAVYNGEKQEDGSSLLRKVQKLSKENGRCIFAVPRVPCKGTESVLRKYDAVGFLISQQPEGSIVLDELEIVRSDLSEELNRIEKRYLQPEEGCVDYVVRGSLQKLYRKSELVKLLSQKCGEIFGKTPVVNNESLNKNRLTGAAQKSRAKLVDAILSSSQGNLGLSGTGQEISFMRSALVVPGILDAAAERKRFCLSPKAPNFKEMFSLLENFVRRAEKKPVSFGGLLKDLSDASGGIGLRKGVIPVYLAVVLSLYEKMSVLKKGGMEVPLDAQSLAEVVESPEDFTLHVEKWNDEKSRYVQELERLFADGVEEREKSWSGYAYLVNAMLRWYRSLSQYAKSLREKPDSDFLNVLKSAVGGTQEILFERIPKVFGNAQADSSVFEKIREVKAHFDAEQGRLEERLVAKTAKILSGKVAEGKSLKNLIADFLQKISPSAKSHVFENGAHALLAVYRNSLEENDSHKIVRNLAKTLTGLFPDDWGRGNEDVYVSTLIEWNASLQNFDGNAGKGKLNSAEGDYVVKFSGENSIGGKSFSKVTCSRRARLLEEEISRTMDEVGQSVSQAEKRQILMELLEKMC